MRYVIKSPDGGFYTECDIAGSVESIERDALGNRTVFDRPLLVPRFDGRQPNDASKYDTEQDATEMLTNKFLKDPAAFAGCTVEPFPSPFA